jgi:hypothetical protein
VHEPKYVHCNVRHNHCSRMGAMQEEGKLIIGVASARIHFVKNGTAGTNIIIEMRSVRELRLVRRSRSKVLSSR